MHSLICRLSSVTTKVISRPTRRVWLSTMPRNGNVSGAMWTKIGFDKETSSIRDLRVKHVAEAHERARNLDLSATSIRKACLSFPSKTAIGLDQHAFKDIALLPDNALGSLGEIIRQCFVKLAIPTQSLLQLLVLLGKKNGGSRTIAILHTTYRLTMRLVSAHISPMGCQFRWKVGLCTQG